jgi:hypothetical protein
LSEGAAAGLSSRCSWALTGARRALHEAEEEEEEEEEAEEEEEEEEAPIVRPSTPSTTGARNTPTWCQRW